MAHIRLHVQQADGHLPMICMRCGAPATGVKSKKMAWYPRAIVLLVLLSLPGVVLLVILGLILTRRARLQAPFCDRHQGHWLIRTTIMWTATAVLIAVGIGVIALMVSVTGRRELEDAVFPFACFGSVALMIGWLILLAVLAHTAIRPDEITRTHMLLNGVSEEFVQAVEEAEIERRVRLRQWQVEDEAAGPVAHDDKRPPPRKPSVTDAIEEPRPPRPAPPPDAFEK
jgi:hypothetical protein